MALAILHHPEAKKLQGKTLSLDPYLLLITSPPYLLGQIKIKTVLTELATFALKLESHSWQIECIDIIKLKENHNLRNSNDFCTLPHFIIFYIFKSLLTKQINILWK